METTTKPRCQLTGEDGNVFALAGQVTRALRSAGQGDKVSEFTTKLFSCGSYDEALQLMMEYVEVE